MADEDSKQPWSQVPKEILSYLTEVEAHYKTLDDAEEKQLLVSNVLDELTGSELVVIVDTVGSRLLEVLLKDAAPESVLRMLAAVSSTENLYQAATSGPGCHVLEKLITRLLECLLAGGHDNLEELEKALETLVNLVTADLYDYILDRNATYVARRVLCAAAGRDVLPAAKKNGRERESAGTKLLATKGKRTGLAAKVTTSSGASDAPADHALYPELVTKFVTALEAPTFDAETLRGLAGSPFSGPFLQGLLAACKADALTLEALIPRLLGAVPDQSSGAGGKKAVEAVDADTVADMMKDTSSSHLVEAIFQYAPEELQRELCRKCLCGQLHQLAFHPSANFVVQAALASSQHPKLINDFLTELEPKLGHMLQSRRGGVVAALAAACGRAGKVRSQFCSALVKATSMLDDSCGVSPNSAQHLVASLLTLDTYMKLDGEDLGSKHVPPLSPVGCAILAAVLQYPQDACKPFVSSLLGLQPKQLKQVALDRGGCRVLETLIEADHTMQQKHRLMRSLRGAYGQMAVRPAGSFFVEKCYHWADVDVKEDIVCELLDVETQLQSVNWGPGLMQLCGLEVYKNGRDQWWARANRMVKTVAQFAQLFGDEGKGGKKRQIGSDGTGGREADGGAEGEGGKHEKKKKKKRKKHHDGEEDGEGAERGFEASRKGRREGDGEEEEAGTGQEGGEEAVEVKGGEVIEEEVGGFQQEEVVGGVEHGERDREGVGQDGSNGVHGKSMKEKKKKKMKVEQDETITAAQEGKKSKKSKLKHVEEGKENVVTAVAGAEEDGKLVSENLSKKSRKKRRRENVA